MRENNNLLLGECTLQFLIYCEIQLSNQHVARQCSGQGVGLMIEMSRVRLTRLIAGYTCRLSLPSLRGR